MYSQNCAPKPQTQLVKKRPSWAQPGANSSCCHRVGASKASAGQNTHAARTHVTASPVVLYSNGLQAINRAHNRRLQEYMQGTGPTPYQHRMLKAPPWDPPCTEQHPHTAKHLPRHTHRPRKGPYPAQIPPITYKQIQTAENNRSYSP